MTAYIVYHDPCWDGAVAAAIAKNYLISEVEERAEVVLVPYTYKEGLPSNFVNQHFPKDTTVYVLDVAFETLRVKESSWNDLKFLNELANKYPVYWIDHHDSSFFALEDLKLLGINKNFHIELSREASGAKLTANFFAKQWNNYVNIEHAFCQEDSELEEIIGNYEVINYISDYDTWKFEFPDTKAFTAGVRNRFNVPSVESAAIILKYGGLKLDVLIEEGKSCLAKEQEKFENISKSSFLIDIQGQTFVMVNHTDVSTSSNLGNFLYEKYGYPSCLFNVKYDGITLSFRSKKELGEILSVANHFKGGGHNYAAGAHIDIDTFDDLIRKGRKHV